MIWAATYVAIGFFSGFGFWGANKVMEKIDPPAIVQQVETKKEVKWKNFGLKNIDQKI